MNRVFIVIIAAFITSCHFVGGDGSSDRSAIQEAEAKSVTGANPIWLSLTRQNDLFRRVRDRAYGYCLRGGVVDKKCASEQDKAVHSSVAALDVAAAQRAMKNKDSLGRKERYVATNPDVARSVVSSCWALYKEHGAADARVLSVCLGNLTDYSPLAPLPVT